MEWICAIVGFFITMGLCDVVKYLRVIGEQLHWHNKYLQMKDKGEKTDVQS